MLTMYYLDINLLRHASGGLRAGSAGSHSIHACHWRSGYARHFGSVCWSENHVTPPSNESEDALHPDIRAAIASGQVCMPACARRSKRASSLARAIVSFNGPQRALHKLPSEDEPMCRLQAQRTRQSGSQALRFGDTWSCAHELFGLRS